MDPTRPLETEVEDLSTARALIATLQDQLTTSQREVATLRPQLDILCQRLFGKKSERVDARQLQLALEQLANEPGAVTEPIEMNSGDTPVRGHLRRRPSGRRPLPVHLPRRRIEIDIAEVDQQCACGHAKSRIGESIAEQLEHEPASFVVIQTVRAKYACSRCHEGVVETPAPPQAIEKALAGEGLLAHVVVSKYVDHLPLYRLAQIFAREQIDLSGTTLCEWVAAVATALVPIGEQLRGEIVGASYLQRMTRPSPYSTSAAGVTRGGSGPISTRSVGRSSSTPPRRTSGMDQTGSSPIFGASSRPTRIAVTTRCIRTGGCSKSAAWPTRAGFVEAFMTNSTPVRMIALMPLYDIERPARS